MEESDAEENQSFLKDVLSDSADKLTLLNLENQLREDYKEVIDKGIINDKNFFNSVNHVTMRDIGRANVRVAVAIKELETIFEDNPELGKKLGLEKYLDSYVDLVKDLFDPVGEYNMSRSSYG